MGSSSLEGYFWRAASCFGAVGLIWGLYGVFEFAPHYDTVLEQSEAPGATKNDVLLVGEAFDELFDHMMTIWVVSVIAIVLGILSVQKTEHGFGYIGIVLGLLGVVLGATMIR